MNEYDQDENSINQEKSYDYQSSDIFNTVKRIIDRKWTRLLILLLIDFLITGLSYYVFLENYQSLQTANDTRDYTLLWNALEPSFIIYLVFSVFLAFILYVLITKFSLEAIIPLKEMDQTRSFLKKCLHYLFGFLLFYGLIIISVVVYLFLAFIFIYALFPLGIFFIVIFSLVFIGLVIYLTGYYRFIPIIGYFEGAEMMFSKSKKYIYGHLGASIGYSILFGFVINIMTLIKEHTTSSGNFIATIILLFVITIFTYLYHLFDIAFVVNGYYRKKTNQKIREEKEKEEVVDTTQLTFDEE